MPCRKGRKRWRKRSLYCMPLPRPCVDSFPRHYMPHCPVYRPCPPQHAVSGSSLSDYSCPDEEYCTVENCRNAPMCINAQPQYCPYGYNEQSHAELYAGQAPAQGYERGTREMNRTAPRVSEAGYPQTISTPYVPPCFRQGSFPAAPAAQNRTCPFLQRQNECPYNQMSQNTNAPPPCRQQIPVNCPASGNQRVVGRSEESAAQSQQRLPSKQSSFLGPEPPVGMNRDQTATNQYSSYYSPPVEPTPSPSQNFQTSKESMLQDADRNRPQCLNKGKGYCSMKGKCNKELAFQSSTTYHTLPEPSSSGITSGNFAPDLYSTQVSNKSDGPKRATKDPSSMGYNQSYVQPPNIDRMRQQSEVPIPYIHDAVSTSITGKYDGGKCPCPCRYPPAFKHFSCTANISGSCNCRGHD